VAADDPSGAICTFWKAVSDVTEGEVSVMPPPFDVTGIPVNGILTRERNDDMSEE